MDYEFLVNGASHKIAFDTDGDKVIANLNGKRIELQVYRISPSSLSLTLGDQSYVAHTARDGRRILVAVGGDSFCLEESQASDAPVRPHAATGEMEGTIKAPMPGLVIKVDVSEGAEVHAGNVVAVVEAMKMEHELRAAFRAIVTKVHVKPGQQVDALQPLLELQRIDS